MKLKTILKELDTILELLQGDTKNKQKALRRLVDLRNKIALKVKEEEEKEKNKNPNAQRLAKWYWGIWEGRIPEGNFGRVVNVFRSLLEEFGLSEKEIKELYAWWLNLNREEVPKNLWSIYNIVLGEKETRSITDFRGKLRYVKGLKRALEEGETSKSWTSAEYERGSDYYRKILEQRLREEEEENRKEPLKRKQKLPFGEDDKPPF